MGSIVPQKVGKYTYLYESFSYRDSDGKPRNKRSTIGKLDPITGHPIYKPEYIERMAAEGKPIQTVQTTSTFTLDDLFRSTIRDYGAFYLYEKLAEQMGLMT